MGKVVDITGHQYGYLTVIKRTPSRGGSVGVFWECICKCGKTHIASSNAMRTGHIKSCGCLKTEIQTKHGMYKTRFYAIWCGIIQRCNNPNDTAYKFYGAKGVKICKRWLDFTLFKKDMLSTYQDNLSLDRKNPKGNYTKNNCRWATNFEQAFNKSNSCWINTPKGKMRLYDAAKEFNISIKTLQGRFHRKWPEERLLEKVKPRNYTKKVPF